MALNLGSFAIREIIQGIAEDFDGNLLYTLDQLSSAQIEVSSDPTEITDKNGNVIKQIYKSKTATFTATSALLSPNILNAGSGLDAEIASSTNKIEAPKVVMAAAGTTLDVSDATAGTITMIGVYGNGANGKSYDATATAALITDNKLALPAKGDNEPIQYLVKYQREVESGIKLSNTADAFPGTVALTLYVAVEDPCSSKPRAAYLYIPSFQADPSVTISLDSESTETDFTGSIQTSYCDCEKALYYIYFVDEDAVLSAACA